MLHKDLGRHVLAALVLAVGATFACASVEAQTLSFTGSLGATSDFVFRGLSYTQGDPAVQASLDVEVPAGIYIGTFASTTNPNPGKSPRMELDLWAGYQRELNRWLSADLRYTHYMYPDDPRVADYDRDELTATLGMFGAVFVSATYSPNTEAIAATPGWGEGDSGAIEISARHQLSSRWSIAGGVGRFFLDEIYDADYDYWGVTLSGDFAPVEVHLALLGADSTAERIFGSRLADERMAVTVLYRFAFVH